jgi:predicted nucleic acid-binding protein
VSGYLLDTNQLKVAVKPGSSVAIRIETERSRGRRVGTCLPALCELETGIQQVRDPAAYRPTLQFLLTRIKIWPLTLTTARLYGEIHQGLKRRGRALSAVDIMLAASAVKWT